jgi:hypothetical protein
LVVMVVPNGGWSALAYAIAHLIQSLLNWFEQRRRQAAAAKDQADRDLLADDPADWFVEHFSGLRADNYTRATTETDTANAGHHQDAGRRDVPGSAEHDATGNIHSGTGDMAQ